MLFNCSRPEVMGAAVSEAVQVLAAQDGSADAMPIGVYANAFVPLAALTEANEALSASARGCQSAGLPAVGTGLGRARCANRRWLLRNRT